MIKRPCYKLEVLSQLDTSQSTAKQEAVHHGPVKVSLSCRLSLIVEPATHAILTRYSNRSKPGIVSPEIDSISLHNPIPLTARLYAAPFICEPPSLPADDTYHAVAHAELVPDLFQPSTPCSTLPITTGTTDGSNPKNGHSSTASCSASATP